MDVVIQLQFSIVFLVVMKRIVLRFPGLEMDIVMTKPTLQNVTMMVETVVDLTSILTIVINANALVTLLPLLQLTM